jgi:hypothetical protein
MKICDSIRSTKDMECGGRAQRRHRFLSPGLAPKTAWRFASRRSPNSVAAAQAAPCCVLPTLILHTQERRVRARGLHPPCPSPEVRVPSRGEALAFLSAPDMAGRMYAQVRSTALRLIDEAGQACARGQIRLYHQRPHDRRLRPGGVAGGMGQFGRHDLHRQPAGEDLSEEPRPKDRGGGQSHDAV